MRFSGLAPPPPFLPAPGRPALPSDFTPERRKALLLHSLGLEGQRSFFRCRLLRTPPQPFRPPPPPQKLPKTAARLPRHCLRTTKPSLFYHSTSHPRAMSSSNATGSYVAALQELATRCSFAALEDSLRNQFLKGIVSQHLRERLLLEGINGAKIRTYWHIINDGYVGVRLRVRSNSSCDQRVHDIFRTATGCAFHFAKAINARQDELGLKKLCRDNPAFHAWFTRVRHLPFVPDAFRLEFASDLLSDKPSLQPLNAARLDQFERYFRRFWLTNSLLNDIWGPFGNRGARTTNNVEGWHNGLHSRLPSRHPDLAEFLQFLKSAQHAAQNRIQALLLNPLAVAQPHSHVIQTRNNKLHQEMDAFACFISSHPPTFVDVRNYIDRVASSGALTVSH
ncbi:hypothetical protein HPB47_005115 [Ixodes persulcatus]|uniref:Uncharacterized protein n=1 Tax=Ixodes persulcatus TaxID=34615 RepID=A0AC60PDY3_IXOPE|nr:hypothetical protein HPB47_005115 [Ixodes persulcatus]